MEIKSTAKHFFALILCVIVVNISYANCSKSKVPGKSIGSIVIVDDDIRVNSEDMNDHILLINIYDGNYNLVKTFQGCMEQTCTYNISQLQSGVYTIVVRTTLNNYFTQTQYIQ